MDRFAPDPPERGGPEHHVARGRRFEALAEAYLVAEGMTILARNVRFGRREVDLVAEEDGVVVFVEVKGRSGPGCGHPLEAVTPWKRREVEAVARWWIRTREPAAGYRFDAVGILARDGASPEVVHLRDAWRPGAGG